VAAAAEEEEEEEEDEAEMVIESRSAQLEMFWGRSRPWQLEGLAAPCK
jgi:hypothetical protein